MKNLTWQNPEQLFVAQELINKVKSKCCGIKAFKILVLILVALHIYLIFMRWIYWMLDYHYGDFDYIFLKLVDVPNGFEVVDNLYNEVLFDIYYLAFSTIVTIIIAVKYLKQQKKKNEEDNHLH